ncbi:hypothetical protein ACHAWF_017643 [Thalassiosira exigua]
MVESIPTKISSTRQSSSLCQSGIVSLPHQQLGSFKRHRNNTSNVNNGGNRKSNRGHNHQRKPTPHNPPVDFLSDPSASEEELTEIGSSRMDERKKFLYRQRMREFDATSVGDTSLSSSNMSPTPQRFRVQFDHAPRRGGGGKVRDRIRAASAKFSFSSSLMSDSRDGKTNGGTSGKQSPKGSFGAGGTGEDATLRAAALLPPSVSSGLTPPPTGSSSEGLSNAHAGSSSEGGAGATASSLSHSPLAFSDAPPPLPNLDGDPSPTNPGPSLGPNSGPSSGRTDADDARKRDGGRESGSVSSTDSVRGVGIAQGGGEQVGGESSSSAVPSPAGGTGRDSSPHSSPPRPRDGADPATGRRQRRKVPSPHRRVRSGDAVAASIANPGREDWLGMRLDDLRLPDDGGDDDGSSFVYKRSPSSGGASGAASGAAWDGYSADASQIDASLRDDPRRWAARHQLDRASSVRSVDTFDFSADSGNGNGNGANGAAAGPPLAFHPSGNRPPARSWDSRGGRQGGWGGQLGGHARHASHAGAASIPSVSSVDSSGRGARANLPAGFGYGSYQSPYPPAPLPPRWTSTSAPPQLPPRAGHARYASLEGVAAAEAPRAAAAGRHGRYATHVGPAAGGGERDPFREAWLSTTARSSGGEAREGRDPDGGGGEDGSTSSSSGSSCTSSSYTDDSKRRSRRRRVKFDSSVKQDTKFDNIMKRVNSVLDKPLYRLDEEKKADEGKEIPMFYCPNCRTKQRDFINFATAAGIYDSPKGYLLVGFVFYLVSSLFVFGLVEGWDPLDCIYFSVITLTTAGLGDFVPSTNAAKILCAVFIYIGIATIGLLVGNLLAGSMDKSHYKEAQEAQIRDCPNCARLEKLKLRAMAVLNANTNASMVGGVGYQEPSRNMSYTPSDTASSDYEEGENVGLDITSAEEELENKGTEFAVASTTPSLRQSQIHTRHMSIDIGGRLFEAVSKPAFRRIGSSDNLPPPIDESTPFLGTATRSSTVGTGVTPGTLEMRSLDDQSYSSSSTSATSFANPHKPMSRVKAAKYIILTLNQALMNSSFIIAAGSFGFYFIEDMSPVDSFYFTTVLLTSVGYGDIVPVTTAGKVFATIFVIVAGTVLLHNMTLISMIPLELRKRRIEQAVLGQFGDQLKDEELRELSTGRLINRLKLATNRPDGLEECTREMFSLAMLVRLGRITEDDVKATFAAFRRLDIGNYGKLNSRTIIEGEIMRQKSLKNIQEALSPPEPQWQQPLHAYSKESLVSEGTNYSVEYPEYQHMMHHGSPNPYMTPLHAHHGSSSGSFVRKPSMDSRKRSIDSRNGIDSYYSQQSAAEFDYDAYEYWAQNFNFYSPPKESNGDGY